MLDFDELHRLVATLWLALDGLTTEEKKKRLEDGFLDFLIDAYLLGWERDGLPDTGEANETAMRDAIYKEIAGEGITDRISKYVDAEDYEGLQRLADSEYHRVNETGAYDAALASELQDHTVVKKWVTMNDPYVRDTHDYIEGVEIPLSERFYTFDGDSARFPGDFGDAENNVNCRCWLVYRSLD